MSWPIPHLHSIAVLINLAFEGFAVGDIANGRDGGARSAQGNAHVEMTQAPRQKDTGRTNFLGLAGPERLLR
jgi:hypothetical protein